MGKRKLQSDDEKAPAESMPQAAILEQLQQISAQVQGLHDRLDGLENRLDSMEAIVNSDRQRYSNFRNRRIDHSLFGPTYVPVVKYIPGHPFQPHPNVDGVEFAQDYPLGSRPPPNLLPKNFGELATLIHCGEVVREEDEEVERAQLTPERLRQWVRGLFWFYNDLRFQLPDDATVQLCKDTLLSVDDFLQLPSEIMTSRKLLR